MASSRVLFLSRSWRPIPCGGPGEVGFHLLALPFKGRVGWGWVEVRHSGEGRNPASSSAFPVCPAFVIPAKAGTQRLCSLVFGFSRQPPHVPVLFRSPSWRAGHFLLLAQEKVTKEKGTPEGAVGDEAADCASPLRRFADGTSCAAANARASLRAPLRAFSSADSPRPRGPEDQERKAKIEARSALCSVS